MSETPEPESVMDVEVTIRPEPYEGVKRIIGDKFPGTNHNDKAVAFALRNLADRIDHPKSDAARRARCAMLTYGSNLLTPDMASLTTEDRLLRACLLSYRKHNGSGDLVGWDELVDDLHDAICEAIGDDAFVAWNEQFGE